MRVVPLLPIVSLILPVPFGKISARSDSLLEELDLLLEPDVKRPFSALGCSDSSYGFSS